MSEDHLKFEPICRKSGLLINVEKGTGVCSPSRLTLSGISYGCTREQRITYILMLTGISTASELAKENGSMIHLLHGFWRVGNKQAGRIFDHHRTTASFAPQG
jgi:hypothetical protein